MEMLFKTINFIIFLAMTAYFTRKPLKNFWVRRSKTIDETISAAKKAYNTAENERIKWDERLKNIAGEINRLKLEMRNEGELERKKMVDQANNYSNQIIKDAKIFTEHETIRAISEIKSLISDLAIDLVIKRLSKETTAKEHQKIAETSMREISTNL